MHKDLQTTLLQIQHLSKLPIFDKNFPTLFRNLASDHSESNFIVTQYVLTL